MLAVGIVLVLLVGAGWIGVLKFLSARDGVTPVVVEPVSSSGLYPYMPNAGTDIANVTPPADASADLPGNTPGLYGGVPRQSNCDTAAMIAYLQAPENEAKASSWATQAGVTVPDIPGYVATLTPVVLRSDTYVTNPGFRLGQALATISVLQAGTAVLVDKFGTPRVKCFSGNPLQPAAAPASVQFTGQTWPNFSQAKISVVQDNTVELTAFTLVNPENNAVYERPVGTLGTADKLISGPPPALKAPPKPAKPQGPAAKRPPPKPPATGPVAPTAAPAPPPKPPCTPVLGLGCR